ncbi:serine/threonine-protein kinase [Mariniblastus fucicola]|uniref:non-specific serine/threonine protein kinase n=1 Tax=Mariniblastus fucicola TaxID=980251 RepID=A0A5B9P984_9BACT|nr:serine/threonine-protein kinase [Mariniblastus fucicola]QEG22924.1 Serine/threonine-protein kinase PknB [Mariniblastus fucicola]
MNNQNHITEAQLTLLASGEPDEKQIQSVAEHLETCLQCQQSLDTVAAEPEYWNLISQLKTEPTLSTMSLHNGTGMRLKQSPHRRKQDDNEHPEGSIDWHSLEQLMEPPSHPEMLGSIGGYDIEREVGRGGMGIVFKAFDTELNRPLAIKVLSPRLAENGAARQRFAREARAAAAVLHPNVVAIYGVSSPHQTPFLVMPYVAGPSLQRLVDDNGPLEEKEIVRMALQVAAGLSAAHSQGLVHRDIKPANILVESDVSRVLVTDFGLARAASDASMTQTGCFVGTPNYMSPEQALGKRVDARSDLFSLGSVMYFMATGHLTFRAESPLCVLNRISNDEPTPVRQVNIDISKTLSDVIDKLLKKDPEDRIQSAGELHEFLEKYLTYLHQPDIAKPPAVTPRNPESKSRFASVIGSNIGLTTIAWLVGFAGLIWFASAMGFFSQQTGELQDRRQDLSPEQLLDLQTAEGAASRMKKQGQHDGATGQHSAASSEHAAAAQELRRQSDPDRNAKPQGFAPTPPNAPGAVKSPPEPSEDLPIERQR